MTEIKRKGSRSFAAIPPNILMQLNNGEIESANLVEWLAIDVEVLLAVVLNQFNKKHYLNPILTEIKNLKKRTINTVNETIGSTLLNLIITNNDDEIFDKLANHTADAVRCWATYIVGFKKDISIEEKLNQIKIFAADSHFGVREIAWFATRPSIAENLSQSLHIFSKWITHNDANIRRFATEATRPRGVWCAHIEALKQNPELALCILNPLKSDDSKYVQNSVANWLNDASKTKPDFVINLCKTWQAESNTKQTAYIIKRALRTLAKK